MRRPGRACVEKTLRFIVIPIGLITYCHTPSHHCVNTSTSSLPTTSIYLHPPPPPSTLRPSFYRHRRRPGRPIWIDSLNTWHRFGVTWASATAGTLQRAHHPQQRRNPFTPTCRLDFVWHTTATWYDSSLFSSYCSAVVWCAVLCCAVLCCAVLCCAVLCCAVLCCAVLCCAVLCFTVLRFCFESASLTSPHKYHPAIHPLLPALPVMNHLR